MTRYYFFTSKRTQSNAKFFKNLYNSESNAIWSEKNTLQMIWENTPQIRITEHSENQ